MRARRGEERGPGLRGARGLRAFLRGAALAAALLGVAGLGAPAAAAEEGGPEPGLIRASGEAVVRAAPDRAEMEIAVVTRASEAEAAARENAERQERVIAALRDALGEEAELRTAGYGLRPDYRHPEEGEPPEIVGYTATNSVQVATGRLERVGPALDAALAAGANRVTSLRFTLEDEAEVQGEALRLAAKRARAKAEAMAGALGLSVARVRELAESGAPGVPVRERAMRMEATDARAPTPVEPGTLEVRAQVSLSVEIAE